MQAQSPEEIDRLLMCTLAVITVVLFVLTCDCMASKPLCTRQDQVPGDVGNYGDFIEDDVSSTTRPLKVSVNFLV